jgi:DNA polymerase III alpha subunit (gram-positive type)
MLDAALLKEYRLTVVVASPNKSSNNRKQAPKTPASPKRVRKKRPKERPNPDEFLTGAILPPEIGITPLIFNDEEDFDVSHTIYVVFDLETTGFSKERNYIIEIAAQILDHHGQTMEDATFSSLVKPPVRIPSFITTITGIDDYDVQSFPSFKEVGTDFVKYIIENMKQWEKNHFLSCDCIVFVAHNGKIFDVPFLFQHFTRYEVDDFDMLREMSFGLDTLVLAKNVVKQHRLPIPEKYTLGVLYYYVTNRELENAHRASVDVSATVEILQHPVFFENRCQYITKVNIDGLPISSSAIAEQFQVATQQIRQTPDLACVGRRKD